MASQIKGWAKELGFADANLDSIFGLFAPLQTPKERVGRIHAEVADILREDRLRRLLLDASNTPMEIGTSILVRPWLSAIHAEVKKGLPA